MYTEKKIQAVDLLASGISQSEVARRLGISRQSIVLWLKQPDFQTRIIEKQKQNLTANLNITETYTTREAAQSKHPEYSREPAQLSIPKIEVLRQKELEFLQKIENNLEPQLLEGSIRAASILLKVSETRAKLLGLNRKTLPLIDAAYAMAEENVLSVKQIDMMIKSVEQLENDLRIFEETQINE